MAVKKTETVRTRFREAIDTYKELRDFDYVTPLEKFLDKPPSEPERDRVQKSFFKGLKTRFDLYSDFCLKQAFKAADLDPQDPLDREVLLRLFAMAQFPSGQKTRGRKKQWDGRRLCCLLSDFDQVKQSHPSFSDSNICNQIKKRFPDRYRMKADAIRRKLQDARNPRYNTEIDELAAIFHESIEHEFRRLPVKMTELSRQYAIDYLSKAWKR